MNRYVCMYVLSIELKYIFCIIKTITQCREFKTKILSIENAAQTNYIHAYITYIHTLVITIFHSGLRQISHTTYVLCFNYIHGWWDLQFKVDSERQIFEKLFVAFLFTLRVFARRLMKGIFFNISFSWRCLSWSRRGLACNVSAY